SFVLALFQASEVHLPIAILGRQLLFLFFFFGYFCHGISVTMTAAYTRCHLTSIERNTGFDVLSCSINAKNRVNEGTFVRQLPKISSI
ncbi:MAG TPA: hypothetical protein VE572_03230, partial [Nitrososphaeraceae archaeon]|nr:hypothetical protein [Nitrososphaeraceae archaeon]